MGNLLDGGFGPNWQRRPRPAHKYGDLPSAGRTHTDVVACRCVLGPRRQARCVCANLPLVFACTRSPRAVSCLSLALFFFFFGDDFLIFISNPFAILPPLRHAIKDDKLGPSRFPGGGGWAPVCLGRQRGRLVMATCKEYGTYCARHTWQLCVVQHRHIAVHIVCTPCRTGCAPRALGF